MTPLEAGQEVQQTELIIVVGPTATGKTDLALRLARAFDGEVMGADAYQIYHGMNIGTAKPTTEEIGDIRHHLLDVVDPDEHFDAHEYLSLADRAIREVTSRGRRVIIAGGTGLYTRALVRGLADMPGADASLRADLEARAAQNGSAALHEELARVDPDYAAKISSNDVLRIVRALEVYKLSGRPITEIHAEHQRLPDRHRALWLGLDPGRDTLRDHIEKRTERMFEAGFIDEVQRLLAKGYTSNLPPLRALGYRAVCEFIAGAIDEPEAHRLTTRDTTRYAKRQRNWFRQERAVQWFDGPDADVEGLVETFLDKKPKTDSSASPSASPSPSPSTPPS